MSDDVRQRAEKAWEKAEQIGDGCYDRFIQGYEARDAEARDSSELPTIADLLNTELREEHCQEIDPNAESIKVGIGRLRDAARHGARADERKKIAAAVRAKKGSGFIVEAYDDVIEDCARIAEKSGEP